ncbi:HNH endonuclease [Zoogloea dura]|uniref:HNH endonuclease n=1 Tax=Zoogloea dura TaxID=2728840 RepID=A0A848GBW1_9RHOO|nr:HNH endonuclease signature motif containing protein [Zoogloea dura]NML28870.1 HNH endonuclease [Zoogloea dura]
MCTWIVDEDDRPNHLDVYFPYGVHSDFVKFFIENGRCLNCNAPIKKDFSRCDCTLPHYDLLFESPDFHLVIESPGYGELIEKERLRVHRERRVRRIAISNKVVTKDQIDELFSVQEGRCYYCGILLIDAKGKRKFHKDHYRSLKNGGLHSIDNIVLACASCNIAKREDDGDEVSFFYHKSLTQAEKRRMPQLRKKVAAFHEVQKEQADL